VNNAHRAHVGILGSVEAIARAKARSTPASRQRHRGGERGRPARAYWKVAERRAGAS
jgi:hypothetical protein